MTPPPLWACAAEDQKYYFVYFLWSDNAQQCYIGWTTDLQRRLCEHNSDMNQSTKGRGPYRLIYFEAYSHKEEATGRERALKKRPNVLKQLKIRLFKTLPVASSRPKEVVG